jgi:hypothetical protein
MTESKMTPTKATALRKPFPPESIGRLPKGGQMLDFAGHAAVTDRLLSVDPEWSWEFAEADPATGKPSLRYSIDPEKNLWIRLTICGVTRIGVGDGSSAKERIGDALRNAAMRFGVALDLWAKENLVEFAQAAQRPADPPGLLPDPTPEPPVHDSGGHEVAPKAMTGPTRAEMFALFAQHDISDEDEQRRGISHIIGREIASRGELTDFEAKKVISALRARQKPAKVGADA